MTHYDGGNEVWVMCVYRRDGVVCLVYGFLLFWT
jgi:hypothetical protein